MAQDRSKSRPKKGANDQNVKADWWARSLGLGSLLVSFFALAYVARTYSITQRPYVGIVKVDHSMESDPDNKKRMRWAVKIKNTGVIPAWVKVAERKVTVTLKQEIINVPLKEGPRDTMIFLMPGGEGTLYGDLPENNLAPIQTVLAGSASLADRIRLVYEPRVFWWPSTYIYETTLKFAGNVPGAPQYFVMTDVKAD